MFVVVVSVNRVTVTVVEVIDVIAVGDGVISSTLTVLVLGHGVLRRSIMFIVVVVMRGMAVTVVEVIDMIAVGDGVMSATFTVLVIGHGVLSRCMCVSHGASFFPGQVSSLETGSCTCTRASVTT